MATYLYETTDDAPVRRFEIRQSMNDRPLETDPETGRPVRRVITGGFGLMGVGASSEPAPPSGGGHSCCGGCGCGH